MMVDLWDIADAYADDPVVLDLVARLRAAYAAQDAAAAQWLPFESATPDAACMALFYGESTEPLEPFMVAMREAAAQTFGAALSPVRRIVMGELLEDGRVLDWKTGETAAIVPERWFKIPYPKSNVS